MHQKSYLLHITIPAVEYSVILFQPFNATMDMYILPEAVGDISETLAEEIADIP